MPRKKSLSQTEIATENLTQYTWDYHSRLTRVVTKDSSGNITKEANYTYDVFDRRISKSVTPGETGPAQVEHLVYDDDNIVLAFDGSGNQTHRYLYGPGTETKARTYMGWFFTLSAEFGMNQTDAENFAAYFKHFSLVLSDGQQFLCQAGCYQEAGGNSPNWWCTVCPKKADGKDINVLNDWQEMNELAPLLYERLQLAPSFRYAIVGIEVDEHVTYDELLSDAPISEVDNLTSGLVISEDLWRKLGSPHGFVSFRPGYLWIPFRPLTYWGEN